MTHGVRRHFCRSKFCPTVCSKSHEGHCNTTEFRDRPEMRPLTGRWVPGLIQTRRALGLRNNPEVHRRDGARLFLDSDFLGDPTRRPAFWGSSILLERTLWNPGRGRTSHPRHPAFERARVDPLKWKLSRSLPVRQRLGRTLMRNGRQSTTAATSQIFTCPEIFHRELIKVLNRDASPAAGSC